MNTYTIRIPKISCFGYHGCYESEKKEGQWFEVDIEIKFKDSNSSLLNDDLQYAIDYIEIAKLIDDLVSDEKEENRYNLLETLANHVSKLPYKWINGETEYSGHYHGSLKILLVKVRLRKIKSPFICGNVPYVEVEYIRDSYD